MCRMIHCFFFVFFIGSLLASDTCLTNCAQIVQYSRSDTTNEIPFSVDVQVLAGDNLQIHGSMLGRDKTGGANFATARVFSSDIIKAGDILHLEGCQFMNQYGNRITAVSRFRILKTGIAPVPVPVSVDDFLNGKFDFNLISLTGLVMNARTDEIDPRFTFLTLSDNGRIFYAASLTTTLPVQSPADLIGQVITVSGNPSVETQTIRRHVGRHLTICKDGISVRSKAFDNLSSIPDLHELEAIHPSRIPVGRPYKVQGRILATWHRNQAILQTASGKSIALEIVRGNAPETGRDITAIGFPESDLYNLRLSNAWWQPCGTLPVTVGPPMNISARSILTDEAGNQKIKANLQGQLVRISGIVRGLPREEDGDGILYLDDAGQIVRVDTSSVPEAVRGLSIGCHVEATGVCIMESDVWRVHAAFPRIKGFRLVIRGPGDIVVRERPSWWTPARLWIVIGSLALFFLLALIWNILLERLVARRGRELFKSEIRQTALRLRIDERSRLAVELHDSISQTLTGIGLEVNTVGRLLDAKAVDARRHLEVAAGSLRSCRAELKNCLWDLRNDTLDQHDLSEAIRQTVAPHIGTASLTIRFNVSHRHFSDTTLHPVLCIIRELATNAVRHGGASSIKIAGALDKDILKFSVTDNGKGFDPSTCPGIRQGHFGLQGIRERIRFLDGELQLVSSPGHGCQAIVLIRLKQSDNPTSAS